MQVEKLSAKITLKILKSHFLFFVSFGHLFSSQYLIDSVCLFLEKLCTQAPGFKDDVIFDKKESTDGMLVSYNIIVRCTPHENNGELYENCVSCCVSCFAS